MLKFLATTGGNVAETQYQLFCAEYWRARVKIGASAVGRLSYYGAVSSVSGGAKIFLVQLTYF